MIGLVWQIDKTTVSTSAHNFRIPYAPYSFRVRIRIKIRVTVRIRVRD